MSEVKANSISALPILIMRSILNSKSLDDFCQRLSILISDVKLECSIHKLGQMETIEVLGSVHNDARSKQPEYPSEIRPSLIRCLINGSPAWFHNKNQIWSEGEFGSDFISGGLAILIIPLSNELEYPIWLEFRQINKGSQFRIDTEVIYFLQLALAVKIGSNFGNAITTPSSDTHIYWEAFDLTARQKLIATLLSEGDTNNQIANHLHVSQSLIKLEVRRIFKELNVSKRSELIGLNGTSRRNWTH